MKTLKPVLSVLFLSFLLTFTSSTLIYSATDNSNVVISEVQIAGSSASDEFVELYNPTDNEIDMSGWRLTRFSSTGTEANLDSSISGVIAPHGYYLLAHSGYDGEVNLDEAYSTSNNISTNGAVRLYSEAGVTVVDTVGFGSNALFETQTVDNPATDGSVSRTDGLDSDNNFDDFSQNEFSDPQNSASVSATPTPTPTSTPTAEPTESPIPTETPSPSPSPTPTVAPTITAEPTVAPTSPPVRTRLLARFGNKVCRLEYRYTGFGFFRRVAFPRIVCS